jgi:5-methylcytosine-specific restriction protein A
MAKNPKWHRDEIILALDLYFDPNRGPIDAKNPQVIQLSELLNKLPLFPDRPDEKKFRNPNGVGLKLSNFLAIDPAYGGKGMASYSKLDKAVFDEFNGDRERLRAITQQIKEVTVNESLRQKLLQIEEDENYLTNIVREGQVLYKLHKYKERNTRIAESKKEAALKAYGKLACEVCSFDFFERYGKLGQGFIECHHRQPLSTYQDVRDTRIDDLALVCANCHRMLHRDISVLTVEALKERLRKY